MDAVIITAITAPFAAAIAVLWGFVVSRFRALEKANELCEARASRLEKRLDNFLQGEM